MSQIPFKTIKSITGRTRLKYQCPKCKATLESELEEAGRPDKCPDCATAFLVPGVEVLKAARAQQEAAAKAEDEKRVKQTAASLDQIARNQAERDRRAALEADQDARLENERQQAIAQWASVPANYRYPTLASYCISLRRVGFFFAYLPLIILVVGICLGVVDSDWAFAGVLFAFVSAIPCLVLAMSSLLASESIKLFLDMREDVAKLVVKNARREVS